MTHNAPLLWGHRFVVPGGAASAALMSNIRVAGPCEETRDPEVTRLSLVICLVGDNARTFFGTFARAILAKLKVLCKCGEKNRRGGLVVSNVRAAGPCEEIRDPRLSIVICCYGAVMHT